jgi:Laminin G domain
MRVRRWVVVLVVAAAGLVGASSPAGAGTARIVALWQMNERPGARTMLDSSGHGLRGTIGGEIATGVRVSGATAYRFSRLTPDTPPAHPHHLVIVPDYGDLDPGSRDYAVTVRLRTTYQFGNIIQKGQATVSGGNFKLQIPNGVVQCLFRGTRGTLLVSSPRRYNDGYWHTVRCERLSSGVVLSVDGSAVARKSGWTGPIGNSWPLSIGGKTTCDQRVVGCDYYAGDLDYIQIDAR